MYFFECKPFYQLSHDELYAIMVLRQEVFVVEQDCPYLDADGKDQSSWHLMGFDQNQKAGRLFKDCTSRDFIQKLCFNWPDSFFSKCSGKRSWEKTNGRKSQSCKKEYLKDKQSRSQRNVI